MYSKKKKLIKAEPHFTADTKSCIKYSKLPKAHMEAIRLLVTR